MNILKKIFKSKLDRLVSKKSSLENLKDKIKDKMHEENSNIETTTKALIDKSLRNKAVANAKCNEIDREINKINKLIQVEREYAFSIEDGGKK